MEGRDDEMKLIVEMGWLNEWNNEISPPSRSDQDLPESRRERNRRGMTASKAQHGTGKNACIVISSRVHI
jgi:hypothetical protein